MLVILDSNTIIADFHLSGTQFRVLLESLPLTGISLAVPAIVLDEVCNKYGEILETAVAKHSESKRQLHWLLPSYAASDSAISVASATRDYATELRTLLARHHVSILPYPTVEHKDVVARELSRKKPFGGPSGYRDYLVWRSAVVAAAVRTEHLVLITENVRDFADGEDIHPDLLADMTHVLAGRGATLSRGLRAFNELHVLPHVARANALRRDIGERVGFEVDLYQWVTRNLNEILDGDDLIAYGIGDDEYGRAGVPRLVSAPDISVIDVLQLSSTTTVVRFRCRTNLVFSVSIDWDDFQRSERIRDLLGDDDEPFSYASFDHQAVFHLELEASISGSPPRIEAWDMLSIRGF